MKSARQLSIAMLALTGITALFLSYYMITEPSGSSLGFPVYLLNGSMFSDYATPGWILLVTVGLLSMFVIVMITLRNRYYSVLIMLQGAIVCLFVFMAILLLDETFLIQYLFLAAGILLIALGVLQYQRKIMSETKKPEHPVQKSHHHKHRKHK